MRPGASALRGLALSALAVGLIGAAASPTGAAQRPPVKVTVNDFFFAPTSVTIRKGRAVRWVWSARNTKPHDVHLKQGPGNLERNSRYSTTTTAVTEARFQRVFEVPGTYRYICTVHPRKMRMTLTVNR
ncbi:MAG TPA: plastocyanin/azurin family copper-binding protein [Solirubrobacterales bacterium]|nr:plastocyanin/azurin family copper-binding protein [Solirubrobacterales bacterium]